MATPNDKAPSMKDAICEAAHTLIELARDTRAMIDAGAKDHDCSRRNCETICTGLRDLAEAVKHS